MSKVTKIIGLVDEINKHQTKIKELEKEIGTLVGENNVKRSYRKRRRWSEEAKLAQSRRMKERFAKKNLV